MNINLNIMGREKINQKLILAEFLRLSMDGKGAVEDKKIIPLRF